MTVGGISNQSPAVLKKSTGAANVGRGGSTVDADLTALEESVSENAGEIIALAEDVVRRVNPLANAVRVAMSAASSGSTGIKVLDNVQIDFGTNDFSIDLGQSLADWTPSAVTYLYYHYQNDDNRIAVYIDASGYIVFLAIIGGVRVCAASTANNITTSTAVAAVSDGAVGKLTMSVIRETASLAGSIIYYVDGVQLGTAIPLVAATPVSFSIAGSLYFMGTNAARNAGSWLSTILYNRALSLSINGPALADIGASQVPKYTSDFSAGVDGWTDRFGTSLTGNTDSIGGEDDWLKITATGTGANRRFRKSLDSLLAGTKGKRFSVKVFCPSTNSLCAGLRFRLASGTTADTTVEDFSAFLPTLDTVQSFTVSTSANASTATQLLLAMVPADGSVSSNVASGDEIYIKVAALTETGIVLDLNAEDCQGDTGQIFDRSGNKNHALLPASGAKVIGAPLSRRCSVRSAHSWNGTSEAQYISLANQAVLPLNAYIDRVLVVAEGTPVDGRLGDSVDNDRFCTLEENTGLAVGMNDLALNRRTTDGTNGKLLWTPSASGTYTLKFTVEYIIPEV